MARLMTHCGNPRFQSQNFASRNRWKAGRLLQMDTSNTQAVSANLRLRYNYRPDSDLYVIYNVGTQFASIAPANPPQVRETRFAVKWTYSFAP
jgi:hypothetical protein